VAWAELMNPTVLNAVDAYLRERRQLGYELLVEGQELRRFARYADESGHTGPLTCELAIRWAQLPAASDPLYQARRLDMVRRFAKHQTMHDSQTEVPPPGILGRSYRRCPPHIYSAQEIDGLLEASSRLGPQGGLRPHTYRTLFGLLACTGLRISEALGLTRADVDLHGGVVTVTETKFHKSRLVPLHSSAVQELRAYAFRRDGYLSRSTSPRFFLTEHGTALKYWRTLMTFLALRKALGWVGSRKGPRIHDLRHTFAVRTLLRWYNEGASIGNRIVALSTYLGHAKVSDTYWYLSAAPELMAAASSRFEASNCVYLGGEGV
jgi:integrase